jgi:hypothetical protein
LPAPRPPAAAARRALVLVLVPWVEVEEEEQRAARALAQQAVAQSLEPAVGAAPVLGPPGAPRHLSKACH